MIDSLVVINYARDKSLDLMATNSGPTELYFSHKTVRGISVKVNLINNSFTINGNADHIFTLTSGEMSPFYEDPVKYDHFNKMFQRFMKSYYKLWEV